jgi:hypothetical protein
MTGAGAERTLYAPAQADSEILYLEVELTATDSAGLTGRRTITITDARDLDADGCTDGQEIGTDAFEGGRRDPQNFWDVFDTNGDGGVSGPDFFNVLSRFGSSGNTVIDPRSEPPPPPEYHTAFDRGPSAGPHPWSLTAADGTITGRDFFAFLTQFGHAC